MIDEKKDWRVAFHTLPTGLGPPSRFGIWVQYGLMVFGLFVMGGMVVVIGGMMIGITLIGSEYTGGTYMIIGFIINLLVGLILAAIAKDKGRSRWLFYSFTAPVYLSVAAMIVGCFS